jgi:catalase
VYVIVLIFDLQEDYHLTEKLAQFDRERIPERVVHARGAAAKGFFEVTHDISHLTCADVFRAPGVQVGCPTVLCSVHA